MSILEARALWVDVRYTCSPWYSIRPIFSRIDRNRFRSAGRRGLNFGWCLLKGASSLGSSSDAPELSYGLLCFFPLSTSLLEQFPPPPPAGSLQRSSQGVPLPAPPYRLLCRPRSQTLVTTGGLDLLWLPKQSRCDQLYPLRDPGPSSPA
jgi:hypothetical protein